MFSGGFGRWLAASSFLIMTAVFPSQSRAALEIATVTVHAVDVANKKVEVRFGGASIAKSFDLSEKTSIQIDRVNAKLADVKAGQKATMMFDGEKRTVSSLRILTGKSTPKTDGGFRKSRSKTKGAGSDPDDPQMKEPPADDKDSKKEDQRGRRRGKRSASVPGWPQWRGPNQDGKSDETGLLARWPGEGPQELWSAPMGEGYSGIAVADGFVYTLVMADNREHVLCVDVQTGKEQWRHSYDGAYTNGFGNGPRSTPTVDGDVVYTLGATGIFHCLDAESGKVKWSNALLRTFAAENIQWGQSASPVIHKDLLLLNPGGPNGNSMVAMDKDSGKVSWRSGNDNAGYSTPIVIDLDGTETAVFFTGKALVGMDADHGKELFRYPWKTDYDCNVATPVFAENCLFISSGYGTGCACLEVTKGRRGVDLRERFRNKEMKNHFSTSIHHDGHVYGFDDVLLTCLDFKTGSQKWVQRGFQKGSLTMADGKFIVLGEQGRLALVEANPDQYTEISSFQALQGKCWTMPVVADGRLYARNEKVLRCFDLRDGDTR